MELTRTVIVEDKDHSLTVTLPEPMSLPEVWNEIVASGRCPAQATMEGGVVRVTFGEKPHGDKV